jgi:hypothetical protein
MRTQSVRVSQLPALRKRFDLFIRPGVYRPQGNILDAPSWIVRPPSMIDCVVHQNLDFLKHGTSFAGFPGAFRNHPADMFFRNFGDKTMPTFSSKSQPSITPQ